MDLHSGLPFWIVKNELYDYFNPLREDYKVDVAIIGSGITGALVAHELCSVGIECAIFDKRTLCTGSSAASTSQLQYEIDVPLVDIIKMHGATKAVAAYKESLNAITSIEKVFKSIRDYADFKRISSVYTASDKKGIQLIETEYEARVKYGLPVEFLDEQQLWDKQNNNFGTNITSKEKVHSKTTKRHRWIVIKARLTCFVIIMQKTNCHSSPIPR